MICVNQIKVDITHTRSQLEKKLLQELRIPASELLSFEINKQSIDARKKNDIKYVYTLLAEVRNEEALLQKCKKARNIQQYTKKIFAFEADGTTPLTSSPVVVGSGPAGLFCAYELACAGYQPILIERGAPVEERLLAVEKFWETGILDTETNVQFGEGGAGTFSDGKLNTSIKDPFGFGKRVLELFVKFGAPEAILYESKPHIGTDLLIDITRNIRNAILENGGTVRFHSKLTGLQVKNDQITGIEINHQERIQTSIVVLAIGHSARDTFEYLNTIDLDMEAKSFAIGVRVEHPQETINVSQYGERYAKDLPTCAYKLTATASNNRGVYSFCMCPGGYVVDASSEKDMLAINGMSYSKRDGANANSAIVVTVSPHDYGATSPLDGMFFQRELEKKTFQVGGGKIPVQRFEDFCNQQRTRELKTLLPAMKGNYVCANIRDIFPDYIAESIEEGMHLFGKKIKGFDDKDVLLSAIESRTSSPVRILRNKEFESTLKGLFPCGEGAGYAGGITSAAMDGIKVAQGIGHKYKGK